MLAPHLEFRTVDEHTGMLVSETFNAALYGKRYIDLLPLLDGARSRREIAAALADRHSLIEIQTALVSLASSGRVVSGEFEMDRTLCRLLVRTRQFTPLGGGTPGQGEGANCRRRAGSVLPGTSRRSASSPPTPSRP